MGGNERGFRVLATGMRVHVDYYYSDPMAVGDLELICGSTGETLGFISVSNDGTSEEYLELVTVKFTISGIIQQLQERG